MKTKYIIVLTLTLFFASLSASAQPDRRFHPLPRLKSGTFEGILIQDDYSAESAENQDPLCKQFFQKLNGKQIDAKVIAQVKGPKVKITYALSGDVTLNGTETVIMRGRSRHAANIETHKRTPLVGFRSVDLISVNSFNGPLSVMLNISEDIKGTTQSPLCQVGYYPKP